MNFRHLLLAVAAASRVAAAAPPETQAVEFFNPALQHYFITADANEALGIDAGNAGPGWTRTGRSFGVWLNSANAPVASAPVCRFYSLGANSHFFTANAAECASLQALEITQRQAAIQIGQLFTGWTFEGIAFTVPVPPAALGTQKAASTCPAGTEAIFRSYNNGFATGQGANHRFVNDPALQALMVERGYANEGVAFCAPTQSSGTSAPSTPSAGSFPELAATWTGPSSWELKVLPAGAQSETKAPLSVSISDAGALTGSGNGCTLTGAISQVDGFLVFYTGTIGAAGCTDTAFNGSYPLNIERLGSGQLRLHFGQESATAEVEVEAMLSATTPPPSSPPPAAGDTTWTGTVAWIATQRTGNTETVIASVNQPLSLTLDGSTLTGTGFGCAFAGTLQMGNEGKLTGTVATTGCQEPSFNGSYTKVELQRESGIALEVELEKSSQSGQTTVSARIHGVLLGQNGTSNPHPTPPPQTPPPTTGSWSGDARFLAVQTQTGHSTVLISSHETLSLSLANGVLTGSGFGCSFAGTLHAANDALVGTAAATGCTDANFNGTYSSVALRSEDGGAVEVEFEMDVSTAQGTVKVTIAGSLAVGGPASSPPPPPAFVLAGTWGANDVEWAAITRQGNGPAQIIEGTHALSLSISAGNSVTGSGFGCSFTGSVQQPVASVPAFVASLQASGCSNSAFDGSYSGVALHASKGGALELEADRTTTDGNMETKVRIDGVLNK